MKILFVINPISGATSNDEAILNIHRQAAEKGFDFKFLYTTGENDDEALVAQIEQYKPDRIIAGGGDGTIQLVVRNLINIDIPLGILPLGSANGLATALNFSQNTVESVKHLTTYSKTIPLDLLKVNDKYICAHLGDIGVNALIVKKFSEQHKRGMMGYIKHLMRSIKESPKLRYTIKTPEGIYHKKGYMLSFANGNKYGTGIHISEGSVSDGKFEICNVPRIAIKDFLKACLTRFNFFTNKNMFSDVISTSKADIYVNRKIHYQIDGEYMGETNHLKIEIMKSAIKLLVS
jgi:diacylglycerol kinase (ATP)